MSDKKREEEAKAKAEAEARAKADAEAKAAEEAGAKADAEAKATDGEKTAVHARHKTQFPTYRCAGIALTKKGDNLLVTKEQLERLRRDPWVELRE